MKQRLSRPVLVDEYVAAVWEVYGRHIKVRETDYPKFEKRELELIEAGLSISRYAMAVARIWRGWVIKQGLNHVPVNVFLGPKSWQRFMEVQEQTSVEPEANKVSAVILNDELTVARLYVTSVIGGSPIPVRRIASALSLSPEWREAFDKGTRPTGEAAKIICMEYGIEYRSNYLSIGEFVRGRKLRVGRRVQAEAHCAMP